MYSDLTKDDDIPFAAARITRMCGDSSPHIESERDGIRILRKEYMKSRSMIWIVAAFCLALTVGAVAQAQAQKNLKDEIQQSEKAARVFREIMDTPDKGIPQELLDGAECVAVFPSVFKAGFIFGGRGGRGGHGQARATVT